MVAGMARGLLMLSQKPNHTGHTMEDTGTERGQLTQSQRLSPTTLVDTTAAIMARGLLMLSQKPNHTGHTMQEDTTSLARGLLMLSQKLSPTGHTMEDTGMAR